jgi:hypothetical protein
VKTRLGLMRKTPSSAAEPAAALAALLVQPPLSETIP